MKFKHEAMTTTNQDYLTYQKNDSFKSKLSPFISKKASDKFYYFPKPSIANNFESMRNQKQQMSVEELRQCQFNQFKIQYDKIQKKDDNSKKDNNYHSSKGFTKAKFFVKPERLNEYDLNKYQCNQRESLRQQSATNQNKFLQLSLENEKLQQMQTAFTAKAQEKREGFKKILQINQKQDNELLQLKSSSTRQIDKLKSQLNYQIEQIEVKLKTKYRNLERQVKQKEEKLDNLIGQLNQRDNQFFPHDFLGYEKNNQSNNDKEFLESLMKSTNYEYQIQIEQLNDLETKRQNLEQKIQDDQINFKPQNYQQQMEVLEFINHQHEEIIDNLKKIEEKRIRISSMKENTEQPNLFDSVKAKLKIQQERIYFLEQELQNVKNDRRNTFEPNYSDDFDLVNFDNNNNNNKFLKMKTEFNDISQTSKQFFRNELMKQSQNQLETHLNEIYELFKIFNLEEEEFKLLDMSSSIELLKKLITELSKQKDEIFEGMKIIKNEQETIVSGIDEKNEEIKKYMDECKKLKDQLLINKQFQSLSSQKKQQQLKITQQLENSKIKQYEGIIRNLELANTETKKDTEQKLQEMNLQLKSILLHLAKLPIFETEQLLEQQLQTADNQELSANIFSLLNTIQNVFISIQEEKIQFTEQIMKLQDELENTNTENSEIKQQYLSLRDSNIKLSGQLNQLHQEIFEKDEQLDQFKQIQTSYQQQSDNEMTELQAQTYNYQNLMKMKDSQIDEIKKEYDELNEKIDYLNQQLDDQININKEQEDEIIKLQDKNQYLSEDVKNYITEKLQIQEEYEKQLQEARNTNNKEEIELHDNYERIVHEKKNLQEDYEKMVQEKKKLQEEIKKQQQDYERLLQDINEKISDRQQQELLQTEIQKLNQALTGTEQEIQQLSTRLEKSKNKKRSYHDQIQQQESQIKLQQSQYKQLETDLLQVRMKLSNEIQINELKDKQMDDLKKSLKLEKDEFLRVKQQQKMNQSSESNENNQLRGRLEELSKDNKRLQQEKEKVVKDRMELQRQVVEIQATLDELNNQMVKSQEKEQEGYTEQQAENTRLNRQIQQLKLEKQRIQEDLKKEIHNYQQSQTQITQLQSDKFSIEKDQCLLKEQIGNWQRICQEKEEEKTEFGKKQEELIESLKIIENNFKQTNLTQKERLVKSEQRAEELNRLITEYEDQIIIIKEELEQQQKENKLLQENVQQLEEQIKQQQANNEQQNELNKAIIQEKNATSSEQEGQLCQQQQMQILSNCGESQQQLVYVQDKNQLMGQVVNSIENLLMNIEQENNKNLYVFLKNVQNILETDNQQEMYEQLEQVKPCHKKSSSIPLSSSKLNDRIISLFQSIIACILDENINRISQNVKTIEEILDENEINSMAFELEEYFKQLKHQLKQFFLKRFEIQEENQQLIKQQQEKDINIDNNNKDNNNQINFVNVENVSNLSIMSDFSELFGESNLQQYQTINDQAVQEQLGKSKLGRQQFKKIQLDELNKLQKEKQDLEIANEQLKEFNEQLRADAKDQEKNEWRFQQQKALLQQEISQLQEKIQNKAQENMSAHEREHIKTNLLKFLGCAYNKQSQEGDEYLKRVFGMVGVNETDQEEFKRNEGIKSDKKRGFISLIFKR